MEQRDIDRIVRTDWSKVTTHSMGVALLIGAATYATTKDIDCAARYAVMSLGVYSVGYSRRRPKKGI
jgi:hypothetical protein